MNTQQLKCFIEVSDQLNFTKAAEHLYLSAPTVTHHIQTLEDELGATLLIRNNKSVSLTPAGEAFYNDALDIIERIHIAQDHVNNINASITEKISIGCSTNTEVFNCTEFLQKIHKKFPGIRIHIDVYDYHKLVTLVKGRQLDFYIGPGDITRDVKGLKYIETSKTTSCAVVHSSNPLCKKEFITLKDIEKENILITLHPNMTPFRTETSLQPIIRKHRELHPDYIAENEMSAITLASCGLGVALLPDYCLPINRNNMDICTIPILDEIPMSYGAAYYRDTPASVKISSLLLSATP